MRNKTMFVFLLAAIAAATLATANAGSDSMAGMDMQDSHMGAKPAAVKITGGWIRALPAGLPAGGYFTLRNEGDKTLELVGASSPVCGMVMLHKSESAGGTSRMSDVASLKLAPHGTLVFAPGGYHLMCMQPKGLKPGDTAPVTLKFRDGSTADARFAIRNAAGN